MKWIAMALLAGAAIVYGIASLLQAKHAAWGYVAAFAEAAMVGALADWFAVVALFRHPFGLPVPHTAIIPSNKDRIGENLATFICSNFLGTTQVLEKVRVDSTRLLGNLLDVLTADGRHQQVLDAALRQLGHVLDDETLKQEVADVVAAEVKYLRFVGLDSAAGRFATEKMVAGVARLISEMGEDSAHPLRQRFDAFMSTFIAELKHDPAMHEKGERLKVELLGHPQLATYLHGLWSQVIDWTRQDLARGDSALHSRAAAATQALGQQLKEDAAMRGWIDAQLLASAPRWIDRYREDIRRYIVDRVSSWNADEMTAELERNIGRDLQFIRINGTLVGGLAGLLIHAATEVLRTGIMH